MKAFKWTLVLSIGLASCGIDVPKQTQSSFETITVKKTDIEVQIH